MNFYILNKYLTIQNFDLILGGIVIIVDCYMLGFLNIEISICLSNVESSSKIICYNLFLLYTCTSCLQNYWREFEGILLWRVCIYTRVPSNNFGGNSSKQQVHKYYFRRRIHVPYNVQSLIILYRVMDCEKSGRYTIFCYIV